MSIVRLCGNRKKSPTQPNHDPLPTLAILTDMMVVFFLGIPVNVAGTVPSVYQA